MSKWRKPAAIMVVAACVLATFWRFAAHGLQAQFMPDDLMNLHRAVRLPASQFLAETIQPWSGTWRPFGFLVEKWMYLAFGFNPAPYHAVQLALLLVNIGLGSLLAWKLSNSGITAAFTAFLFCHHAYFSDLYLNSGTIFDVLALTLAIVALLLYLDRPRPSPLRGCVILLLALLALKVKEIALFLPVAMWGYELLLNPNREGWWKSPCAWAVTLLSAIFALGILFGGGEMMANPDYRARLTPVLFLERWAHYLGWLTYHPAKVTSLQAALALGAGTLVAVLFRDAVLRWSWLLLMLAPLPVLVITPRSFYAFYIPYLFCAIFVARLIERLAGRRAIPAAVLFAVLVPVLWKQHRIVRQRAESWYGIAVEELRPALTLLPPQAHTWPAKSSILFLEDPYPPGDYTLHFVVNLARGDMSLGVFRMAGSVDRPPGLDGFNVVYRMTKDRLERVK